MGGCARLPIFWTRVVLSTRHDITVTEPRAARERCRSAAAWFARFLPHAVDGSGPIKKARLSDEPEALTPEGRPRRHRLRSSTTSAFEVLEFDVV